MTSALLNRRLLLASFGLAVALVFLDAPTAASANIPGRCSWTHFYEEVPCTTRMTLELDTAVYSIGPISINEWHMPSYTQTWPTIWPPTMNQNGFYHVDYYFAHPQQLGHLAGISIMTGGISGYPGLAINPLIVHPGDNINVKIADGRYCLMVSLNVLPSGCPWITITRISMAGCS